MRNVPRRCVRFCAAGVMMITLCGGTAGLADRAHSESKEEQMIKNIHWLGHASFRIDAGDKTIYIDPYKIAPGSLKGDIILVTHDHFDHNSPEDISKIRKDSTVIVAPLQVAAKLEGNVQGVEPGQSIAVEGIAVEAVPAYNTNKEFHQKKNGWVGYIVTVDGVRIYHSGDTDYIPEMHALKVDVALLPVGGTYTMTAEEAAQAVGAIKPKIAIPMHYNSIIGTASDAKRFKDLCKTKVEILKQE